MDWAQKIDSAIDGQSPQFFQLATVAEDGSPSNRTVTFRGFSGEAILFTTDGTSEKARHLRADSRAEACWYFPNSREQYRISGRVALIDEDASEHLDLRNKIWAELSPATRHLFAPESDPDDPPAPFVVGMIVPSRVRYLDTRVASLEERTLFREARA